MLALTGAGGFVGMALRHRLMREAMAVRLIVRAPLAAEGGREHVFEAGDLTRPDCDFARAVDGAAVVVHLAALTSGTAGGDEAAFRAANVAPTLALAQAAARAGVRRFVFLSSLKAAGERSRPGQPLTPQDAAPEDAYGRSKREAEEGLAGIAARTGLEVVVVRPPLVYGPGVKGNFRLLMGLAGSRLPLPLGAVDNRRSLVHADNLADAIVAAATRPFAGPFALHHIRDEGDLSTPQMIRTLGAALGRRPLLLPVPVGLLRAGGRLLHREAMVERLVGSLASDDSAFRTAFGWQQPVQIGAGLAETARWYRALRHAAAAGSSA